MSDNFFKFKNKKIFFSICEDIWAWPDKRGVSGYTKNPLEDIQVKKTDLVINISASPYFKEKLNLRKFVVQKTAKHFRAPMVYVNMVGGQDEIIFDGQSFVMDSKGKEILRCQAFKEELNVFDLVQKKSWSSMPPRLDKVEELRQALVLGLRDFVEKSKIKQVHFGLSGGIDSALVACLATDALGPSRVKAFALPGPFSSPESLLLASHLAKNLGIDFSIKKISAEYEFIKEELEKSNIDVSKSVVLENIQARLRGLFLMAISNSENSMLLNTGNKSELATGYCTLYGDMCGGLSPIGDLTKVEVYQLSELYNYEREIIPRRIIERAPTAELRPNQKDSDSLPAYEILDPAVEKLVERCGRISSNIDKWLFSALLRTEFKRWQAPPILKVSKHSFGRGRRWPICISIN